jgi:putative ATPase
VITVVQASDRERLQAQLKVLDSLRQPQLLLVPSQTPATLSSQLEPQLALDSGARFDWVIARQPWQGLSAKQIEAWIDQAGALLGHTGQWRLLFSTPQLGPAAGLRALIGTAEPSLQTLLEELTQLEGQRLIQAQSTALISQRSLIAAGWQVQQEQWQESLQLELTVELIERWLAPASPYLEAMAALRGKPLASDALQSLREAFSQLRGQPLPQALEHTLIKARRVDSLPTPHNP